MTTAVRQRESEFDAKGVGAQVPYEAINETGTYICNWSGHLLRVPEEAIKPGHSPMLSLTSRDPLLLTKISDDPFIPVSKARLRAAECDLAVNF